MAAHPDDAARMQAKQKKASRVNCWDRLAEDNQDAHFIVDEHTKKKFAAILDENLQSKIVNVDTEDCVSPRMREPIITITVAGRSPMEVILESQRPICDRTPGNSVSRELFPAEQNHAREVPLPSSAVKMIECCISRNDIQQARTKKRAKGSSAFNGLSAKLLAIAWGTAYDEKVGLEFLHLIAKACGGEVNLANLVIGSVDANTKMIAYDASMQSLLEQDLCQYVTVRVYCTLRQKENGSEFTHHAATIQITYETDNGLKFESPVIDANLSIQPSVTEAKLIKKLIIDVQRALLEKNIESCIAEMNALVPPRADGQENKTPNSTSLESPIPRDMRKEPASYCNREDKEVDDVIPKRSERLRRHYENIKSDEPSKGPEQLTQDQKKHKPNNPITSTKKEKEAASLKVPNEKSAPNALLSKDDKSPIVQSQKKQGNNSIHTRISQNPVTFYPKPRKRPSSSTAKLTPLPSTSVFC